MGAQLHSFACGYPLVPAGSAENATLSPLNCFGTLVKTTQLTINVKTYLWTLNSIALICKSIFVSDPPRSLSYDCFEAGFEIRKCESSNCVLFHDCFGDTGSLEFSYEF